MMRRSGFAMLALLALAAAGGCSGLFSTGETLPPGGPYDVVEESDGYQSLFGKGPGEPCNADPECRIGLKCQEDKCTIVGEGQENALCILSDDCGDGLVCSIDTEQLDQPKKCMPEGEGEQWDVCTTDKDCKKGFYCKMITFSGSCQPAGTGDVGAECQDGGDCVAGLVCGVDGRCGIMGAQVPLFMGEGCESSATIGGDPRVLFEIPRKGQKLKDYYRLPFPNDIRIVKGKLDLSGHPTPGPGVVGYDIGALVVQAMSEDLGAFGTNPVVFFRFSTRPDLDSFETKSDPDAGESPNIYLLDITDDQDPSYGKPISVSWVASTGRGLYICQNYLAIYVPWARPLAGDRTFVAIVANTVMTDPSEDEEGNTEEPAPFGQDADMKAVLADAIPDDPDVKTAWDKYAPLRSFLASSQAGMLGLSKAKIAGAAVFTTYDPTVRMAKFKEEMDTIDLPEITEAVVCKAGAISPCDDGLSGVEHRRGCMGEDPNFIEIQGLVKVPTFQEGEKPYVEPKDGGGLEWDALGRPVVKGFEEICFSLTIPKGTEPANGWPVVLYGHGTGGNYRSQIAEGLAAKLTNMKVYNPGTGEEDTPVAMAMFGWDQVLHGPRIGPAPLDPDGLVFNFRNPRGALGNFYQAAAETMVLARLLAGWNGAVPEIAGQAVKFDPAGVQFFGHSQGGISGPLAIPFVDAVGSMVISGTGGGLVESLLSKTSPANVKDGVIVALQDENVGRTHPMLALLQNYYDPVDPINYGEMLFYKPYNGHKVKTLHPLGLGDEHTPPKTMKALSQAMRAMLVKAPSLPEDLFEPYSGVQQIAEADLPYKVSGGVTVEYAQPTQGGHFVVFHDKDAIRHYLNFLGTAYTQGTPYLVK
jgi:hypothetical protein